jgi:hypothetical protein
MSFSPLREYHSNNLPTLLILFDLRASATKERLAYERAGWKDDANVEMLGPDHAVLVVYTGGARRLAT